MRGRMKFIAMINGLCLLLIIGQPVTANIGAEPAGGIAGEGNYLTYLKNVRTFLIIEDESANGTGYYTIYNPSNETENLTICFDPGTQRTNVTVMVDGSYVNHYIGGIKSDYLVHTWMENESYRGNLFNVTIHPKSFSNITIEWNFGIIEGSRTLYTKRTSYIARYLIIGYAGWNHTIDNVEVTFRLNSSHFDEFSLSSGNNTPYDSNGVTIIQYQFTDFDMEEYELVILGDSYTVDLRVRNYTYYVLAGIISTIIVVGIFYYRKKKT